MSRKTTVIVTCDRCKRACDDEGSDAHIALFIERDVLDDAGPRDAVVQFADLCPKCTTRVDNLIAQIRLDKADDATDDGKSGGSE